VAVLSPPYALGATGQLLSGRLLRLSLGATFRPAAAGVLAASAGALHGPPGTMGEATLVNPTTLRIAPARWVVQGTRTADQGQYLVPNDGNVDLAITAQHASQFRRSLWMVTVADSQAAGVASSATTDRALLQLVDGPLSATAPAPLPAVPADSVVLGEVAIPPAGQTVTITPYNPRTTARGAILPVVNDALTYPGHGGEAGAYIGQYRDHPTRGLERWIGAKWDVPIVRPIFQGYSTVTSGGAANGWADIPFAGENYDSHSGHGADPYAYVVPEAGPYALEGLVIFAPNGSNPGRASRITVDGAAYVNAGSGGGNLGTGIVGSPTGRKIWFLNVGAVIRLQGWSTLAWSTGVYADTTSTLTIERLVGA
jgi:hypothetical protein